MFEFIWDMAFQEFEWHAADEVNFDDAKADIAEIFHESGTRLRWYRTSLNKRLTIVTCFGFETYPFWIVGT